MKESKSVTKDPICGMTVDEATALHAERDGKTFYFCSDHCRQKFLSTPNQNLNSINPCRLGLAFSLTGVVFYLACILTMSTVPREKQIIFYNSLLHGLDVTPIMRMNVPLGEVLLGIISTFVLAWFAGAMVAGFYNWSAFSGRKATK
mgnify:CR=1 FL=1